nr:MAG TPA: hypothetical protein [Caudoviricetes sp.]
MATSNSWRVLIATGLSLARVYYISSWCFLARLILL